MPRRRRRRAKPRDPPRRCAAWPLPCFAYCAVQHIYASDAPCTQEEMALAELEYQRLEEAFLAQNNGDPRIAGVVT